MTGCGDIRAIVAQNTSSSARKGYVSGDGVGRLPRKYDARRNQDSAFFGTV
jgi:hypothetical protein